MQGLIDSVGVARQIVVEKPSNHKWCFSQLRSLSSGSVNVSSDDTSQIAEAVTLAKSVDQVSLVPIYFHYIYLASPGISFV